jgi:hypothetical protein
MLIEHQLHKSRPCSIKSLFALKSTPPPGILHIQGHGPLKTHK